MLGIIEHLRMQVLVGEESRTCQALIPKQCFVALFEEKSCFSESILDTCGNCSVFDIPLLPVLGNHTTGLSTIK